MLSERALTEALEWPEAECCSIERLVVAMIAGVMAFEAATAPLFVTRTAAAQTPERPAISYWRLWTDRNGVSHQNRCQLTNFEFESISNGAAPSWIDKMSTMGATVLVVVQPVGWVGEWHENPKPQILRCVHSLWSYRTNGLWLTLNPVGQALLLYLRVQEGITSYSIHRGQHR